MENGCPAESWKSKGLRYLWKQDIHGRLESLPTITKGSHEWYVQPQLQVVRMNVKSDKYHESNGTSIENTGNGNILTRRSKNMALPAKR